MMLSSSPPSKSLGVLKPFCFLFVWSHNLTYSRLNPVESQVFGTKLIFVMGTKNYFQYSAGLPVRDAPAFVV